MKHSHCSRRYMRVSMIQKRVRSFAGLLTMEASCCCAWKRLQLESPCFRCCEKLAFVASESGRASEVNK